MIQKIVCSLYGQVLIAITIGIVLGHFAPDIAVSLKPLGDGFIKLIKMIIAPVIFCTVVSGIAGMEDMKKLGSVGIKALLYFEIVTTLALIIGLVVVSVLKPGAGMHVDIHTLDTKAISAYADTARSQTIVEFLLHIIPANVVDAFAKGELLPVLFFAILFGTALSFGGEKTRPIGQLIDQLSAVFFRIVHMIMKVAPLGALGAMAFTVGKYGIDTLTSLGALIASFYLTCIVFIGGVLGLIARLHGFSIWKFLCYIKEELMIVLGTSSSESAMPRLMEKLEKAGCSKSIVGLVVPTGYSFNLDGTCIYFTMAIMFIAQATDTSLTLSQELTILAVLLITSKGAAGVTGSGFITLAATLATIPTVPVAGLALILGIDRFMSEARALTNIIGNGVATLVIAKWEKAWNQTDFVKLQ